MVKSEEVLEYIKYLSSALSALTVADGMCIPIAPSNMRKLLTDLKEECRRAKVLVRYLKTEEGRAAKEDNPQSRVMGGAYFLALEE